MKLELTFGLLLLLGTVVFAGCYTQLGYYEASGFFNQKSHKHHGELAEEKTGDDTEVESERVDAETSEGYYGRRKYTRRATHVHPYSYYDTYWGPYAPYPYRYYPRVMPYYSYPWFYGYRYGYAPYYRYYSKYYPYTNVYRRYYGKRRYAPLSRRTYHRHDRHPENQRSRSSRGVTSPKPKAERPRR